jgi:myo-inositol-1(or 4)-monophosphatase
LSSPEPLAGPDDDLALLIDAARGAGAVAMRHFRADPQVWDKPGDAGPVSVADLEADAWLKRTLRAARPAYGWLSEETPDDAARLAHDRVFIVDPIDGTRAFIDGRAGWCVALAVVERGVPLAAAAWFPVRGQMYAARLGGGAVLNDAPVAHGGRAEPDGASVLAGKPQMRPQHWPGGAPDVALGFRPSLVHRVCLVADGGVDATLTFRHAWEWDVAAGALIAAEAGCVVTDGQGAPLRFNAPAPRTQGLIAAPPALHAALLARRLGAAGG